MRKSLLANTLAALLVFTGAAQAALHDRGGGLIYDDVLNVTWLQDASYARTSGYDADGGGTELARTDSCALRAQSVGGRWERCRGRE